MKELIIKDLQEIAKQLQRTPTRAEYFKITTLTISRKTILKYFKSYTDAIEQADLHSKPIFTNCNTCGSELIRTPSTLSAHNFCNHSCSAKFTNTARTISIHNVISKCKYCSSVLQNKNNIYCNVSCYKANEYSENISKWIQGTKSGHRGKTKALSTFIRKYMLLKYNNTCQECGWNKLHPVDNKPLVEIDHIDGNASNCAENNLRVLCPNCHSMTPTFRARNKNSTRIR